MTDGNRHSAELQDLVQAARAVALQVEAHVLVADGLESRTIAAFISGSSARAISSRPSSSARERVVMPDAADAEAEAAQRLFGLLDHPQLPSVTSVRYGMRDDRHADAGSSHVGRPVRRDSSRISSLVRSASSSGLRTPNSRAAWRPGR